MPFSQWSQSRKLFVLRVVQKVKIIYVRIGTLNLGNLKPREWRYLTPEVVALWKGKSDSKTTRKTSAKPVRRTAPKTRAKQKRKLLLGLLPKVLQNPARSRHAKLTWDLPGGLRLHHPERIDQETEVRWLRTVLPRQMGKMTDRGG